MGGLTSKANEKLSEETAKHIKAYKKASRSNAYTLEDLSTGIVKRVPKLERTEKSSILKRRHKVNSVHLKLSSATLFVPQELEKNKSTGRSRAATTLKAVPVMVAGPAKRRSDINAQACSGSSLSGALNTECISSNMLDETTEPVYGPFSLQSWVNESIY